MIKNKKSKVSKIKKLQGKAIWIVKWSPSRVPNPRKNNGKVKKLFGFHNLKIGKIYSFKITAIGPKNIGIDEFSLGYSIFIPNTQLGEVVKAKIVKIYNKNYKYAIAQVVRKIKIKQTKTINYNVGDVLEVNISKLGPQGTGIAELSKNYFLLIPQSKQGQKVKVQITRLKTKFGFAKIIDQSEKKLTPDVSKGIISSSINLAVKSAKVQKNIKVKKGTKIQFILPAKINCLIKYLLIKINGLILLVKPTLNAKPGDLVKIKCSNVLNFNKRINLAFAKIIQVHPMAVAKKRSLVQGNLRKMLQNGIHFGEKTVKCHARMKKYIWLRQKGPNKNKALVQKGRHLINLLKTRRCLNNALPQLSKYALKGRTFLFVGTKKSATRLISRVSLFTKNKTAFYVNTRWLGGLLTNWKSIIKSIKKLRPILKQKQTILKKVLEQRQEIKNRLLQKAIIFRKKSKPLIKKARLLVSKLQNTEAISEKSQDKNKKSFREKLTEKALILNQKRKQILTKGKLLLQKHKKLLEKNYLILIQTLLLKETAFLIENQYNSLLNELTINAKKLREFANLLMISQYISELQQSAKQENNRLGIVSYGKLQKLITTYSVEDKNDQKNFNWVIPNPPKDVINKILLILKAKNNQTEGLVKSTMNSNTEPKKLGSRYKDVSSEAVPFNTVEPEGKAGPPILILSQLLNQFSFCLPFIEKSIKIQISKNKELDEKLISLKKTLKIIKSKINYYMDLKNKIKVELNKIKPIIKQQRPVIRLVRKKIKKIIAQKKLIRILPKLRFLPTPQVKISEIVKYLMTNLIDPKLKYPIEKIYDENVKNMSKKLAAARKKRWQRLEKYFGGIAKMTKMKKNQISKNVAIIIGQKEEMNAIRECKKLGIKMFQILDTNSNPALADHFVPANDDSRNALEYLLKEFLVHIRLAQKLRMRLKKRKQVLKRNRIQTNFNKETKVHKKVKDIKKQRK